MASSGPLCNICDRRNISKPSDIWCYECDEGFCAECAEHHNVANATRNHASIPITDYQRLPSSVLAIEQFCHNHNEKFILFCKDHDCPCCRMCNILEHKQCQNITKLEDVVHNVKTSNVFYEMEQVLKEVAENIQLIKKDRQMNLETLTESRKAIEKEINELRMKVNEYLDNLQEVALRELCVVEKNEQENISRLISELEGKYNEINKAEVNLNNIKLYASNLQAYLSIKKMDADIKENEAFVQNLLSSNMVKEQVISFEINPFLKNIHTSVTNFGVIAVNGKDCMVVPVRRKDKQAQIIKPEVEQRRSIDNISLELQSTIKMETSDIRGCRILEGDKMVFSLYMGEHKVIVVNSESERELKLKTPSMAFDFAYQHADKTLFVTNGKTGGQARITQIDVNSGSIIKTIELKDCVYGITENNNMLFYCTRNSIDSINLRNEFITKLTTFSDSDYTYIASFEDKLYHTNNKTNTLTCYDLQGTNKWTFKDENILQQPYGISVDNDGNVYVVGAGSTNVAVISPNGKHCRQLLSKDDGLEQPKAIYFDKSTSQLLVANNSKKAFLYRVWNL